MLLLWLITAKSLRVWSVCAYRGQLKYSLYVYIFFLSSLGCYYRWSKVMNIFKTHHSVSQSVKKLEMNVYSSNLDVCKIISPKKQTSFSSSLIDFRPCSNSFDWCSSIFIVILKWNRRPSRSKLLSRYISTPIPL